MINRFTLLFVCVLAARGATFYCDPARGSATGDGSAEHPWRTIEEVVQAGLIEFRDSGGRPTKPNAPVKPGDTVLLRSGWHGVLRIHRGYNDRPIILAAAPGNTPELGWIEIGEGRNWIVRGLTVSPSLAPSPIKGVPHHLVTLGERGGEESSDLIVEDCFVYSVLDTSGWTASDWVKKTASGIWLGRHGRRHVARNNYVLNTRFGIELCAPECIAEGNVVANFSGDGMRVTRDGQTAQYNVIKNNFVGARDGDDNHDDGIQVFLFNIGTGTVRDVTLRGNIIMARETDGLPFPNGLQGMGCFDGPLVHFLVESNVVCVNHSHGISLYDAQECTIRDNTCFSRWPGRGRPWVMLGQKKNQAGANIVQGNFAHSFQFKADTAVKAENNQAVDDALFREKLAALAGLIDAKFGRMHPSAKRPRLESSWAATSKPRLGAGPLRASKTNSRYFTDESGKAIYLTGSHTWASLQDIGSTNPPIPFDFGAYLDFLERHQHNFVRLWRWEFPQWREKKDQRAFYCAPQPWARTGPEAALDGRPRFDLEKFDNAYFKRLRERTEAAAQRGIYVSIMLFEGWGLRFVPEGGKDHPFHPANNINHTEKELNENFKGIDLFTLKAPRLTAFQEAYVRQVIDAVNDLDNVLFEIANESDFSTTDWQDHMIRFIKKYESTKPKQHPVGMTSIGYGVDDLDRLLKSPADWISPNPDRLDYKNNPPAADGAKVIILDTDHLWGVGGGVPWVWKSFLRGHNPIWMDPLSSIWEPTPPDAEAVRNNLGYTRGFAERMNLAAMDPRPELASTKYCLANAGVEYLVYQPKAGEAFTIELQPGDYRYEWFNPATGKTAGEGLVQAGNGSRRFKSPFKDPPVLYLHTR